MRSSLGSANDFSELRQFRLCRFTASPTFLQWTVRLDHRKSVRPFKGIFCNDISEFRVLRAQPRSLRFAPSLKAKPYGPLFVRRLRAMGIRDKPIAPRSPWQNPTVAERIERRVASALGRGCVPWAIALVRDRRLGVRRVCRVLLDAADEIERGVQRLVVLRIRRDIGLRAGLLVASGPEVTAQQASPRVSVRALSSSGTSCSTSMSGEIPFAWIERPDGVK